MTDINAKDENGITALMRAVCSPLVWRGSGIDMQLQHEAGDVAWLIANGADVNAKDNWGNTALMCAMTVEHECHSMATIQTLISTGADLNASNFRRETALFQAIDFNSHYMGTLLADALIKAGANVNDTATTYAYLSPLLLASYLGNDELCKLLLSAGADASAKDYYGNTVLMYANNFAKSKRVSMCKKMIAAGTDVHATNSVGKTALSIAKEGKDEKLISFLFEKTHGHLVHRKSILKMQSQSLEYSF